MRMITSIYFVISFCPTYERNHVMVWGCIYGDFVVEGRAAIFINNQLAP